MNDVIIGVVDRGSFRFPLEFELLNNKQAITNAVYDTGCSHSLISVDSLNIGNLSIEEFKEQLLYDTETYLYAGAGVESNTVKKKLQLEQLAKSLKQINDLKKSLIGDEKAEDNLRNNISESLKDTILDPQNKNIRFGYKIKNLKIDGVDIGDFEIRLAFNMGNVNLIGMHIIRELYTKIFTNNNKIYLIAKKNSIKKTKTKLKNYVINIIK